MLVRALSSDCMVERYSVSLKETCGKRKFSVLEAREFIHVRLHMVNEAREVNPNLNILGIYLSRYMENCAVDKFIKEQLEEFGDIFIDNNSPHTCDFSRELGEKDNSGCDFCISWY